MQITRFTILRKKAELFDLRPNRGKVLLAQLRVDRDLLCNNLNDFKFLDTHKKISQSLAKSYYCKGSQPGEVRRQKLSSTLFISKTSSCEMKGLW